MGISFEYLQNQHTEMYGLVRQLADSLLDSNRHGDCRDTFIRLLNLVGTHAADEEDFMRAIGYPELSGHRWHHDVILTDLNAIADELRRGRQYSYCDQHRVRALIIDHTEEVDSELAKYYMNQIARSAL